MYVYGRIQENNLPQFCVSFLWKPWRAQKRDLSNVSKTRTPSDHQPTITGRMTKRSLKSVSRRKSSNRMCPCPRNSGQLTRTTQCACIENLVWLIILNAPIRYGLASLSAASVAFSCLRIALRSSPSCCRSQDRAARSLFCSCCNSAATVELLLSCALPRVPGSWLCFCEIAIPTASASASTSATSPSNEQRDELLSRIASSDDALTRCTSRLLRSISAARGSIASRDDALLRKTSMLLRSIAPARGSA